MKARGILAQKEEARKSTMKMRRAGNARHRDNLSFLITCTDFFYRNVNGIVINSRREARVVMRPVNPATA